MNYTDRTYRNRMAAGKRRAFGVEWRRSDLWVAVDATSYVPDMPERLRAWLGKLWGRMEEYLATDPAYALSLVPYFPSAHAPEIFHRMSLASERAGIGPMGAVAGAVATDAAQMLKKEFGCREVIVENGGDIYAETLTGLDISVFAGESPLSERVGFHILPSQMPLGICTSSGTVGHSLSFGKADAVMIAARDAALADSYATTFANLVQNENDIEAVIERIASHDDIMAGLVIKNDRMGVTGEIEFRVFG